MAPVRLISGEYIVDFRYIVAFTSGLDYSVSPIPGYKAFFFPGEGFIAKFQGREQYGFKPNYSVVC